MELRPASMAQVVKGRNGKLIAVLGDVGEIAMQINEISPRLSLHWNEQGEYYQVQELCDDGIPRVVTTFNELDNRILTRLRMIGQPGYDAGLEAEKHDKAIDRQHDHETHERVGEIGEKLAHALRKDLNPSKIIIPAYW